jgi:cephalosporin-C deacetylase-like acetyl esterase
MDYFEYNVLNKKPSNFDEVWTRWIKEVHDIKNQIKIENEGKT